MYFRKIFDDIDVNRDGTIGANELHEALRRGQPNSQFDQRTVAILMEKYDKNGNGRITFDEFFDLFAGINAQFNEFLDVDTDFSGLIDNRELGNALIRRGFNLSPDTLNFISYEISRRNNINGINFDLVSLISVIIIII
jgi:Ca2+-binding EF-hand superfamily protein